MSNATPGLISYHIGRSAEELDRAASGGDTAARDPHLKLSRLHLVQAHWLRESAVGPSIADQVD